MDTHHFRAHQRSLMNDISRLQVISFVLKRPHLMLRRPLATRANSMHTSAFRGKADIAAKTYSARHVRRGSTRRPKAPLPPHLAATVDSLRSQNGDHFVFSWAVPTRRTYLILSLHYDGAVSYFCKFWTGRSVGLPFCTAHRNQFTRRFAATKSLGLGPYRPLALPAFSGMTPSGLHRTIFRFFT